MAIQKTLSIKGVSVTDAYIKVHHVAGNKDEVNAHYEVKADSESVAFDYGQFNFVPDESAGGLSYLKQAYAELKTKDEFVGSIDV